MSKKQPRKDLGCHAILYHPYVISCCISCCIGMQYVKLKPFLLRMRTTKCAVKSRLSGKCRKIAGRRKRTNTGSIPARSTLKVPYLRHFFILPASVHKTYINLCYYNNNIC